VSEVGKSVSDEKSSNIPEEDCVGGEWNSEKSSSPKGAESTIGGRVVG
jgi:hypothetical protein